MDGVLSQEEINALLNDPSNNAPAEDRLTEVEKLPRDLEEVLCRITRARHWPVMLVFL